MMKDKKNKAKISNVKKEIRKFINFNKVLLICLIVSLLVLLLCLCYFKKAEDNLDLSRLIIEIFFQIAIGYIINFIFYITQIYIPHRKFNKSANKCIKLNIEKIVNRANNMLLHLSINIVNKDINDYSDNDYLMILRKLKTDDIVNVINPNKLQNINNYTDLHYTVKEWIINEIEVINGLIDETLRYYANYVTPELFDIFYKMKNSALSINMVNSLLRVQSISFEEINEDIFFSPYYKMIGELKDCIKQFD